MRREPAVDRAVQHDMLARQRRRQLGQHVAGGAVTVIPDHFQHAVAAIPVGEQARDIVAGDVQPLLRAGGCCHHVARRRDRAQVADGGAEEWLLAQHHLEAVLVGRVVAARYHHRAVGAERHGGVIQHRRRAAADPGHGRAARHQTADQCLLQLRAGQPPVIGHHDLGARRGACARCASRGASRGGRRASRCARVPVRTRGCQASAGPRTRLRDDSAEAAADGERIRREERLSDRPRMSYSRRMVGLNWWVNAIGHALRCQT